MCFVLLSLSLHLAATAAASPRALLGRDHNRTLHDVSATPVAIPPAVPAAARHDNNVAIIDHHFSTTLNNAGPDGFRAFEQGGGVVGFVINYSYRPFKMDIAQFRAALLELELCCGERIVGTVGKAPRVLGDSVWYGIGYMEKRDWVVAHGSSKYHESFWASDRQICR